MTVFSLDPYEKLDAGFDHGALDSLTPDEVNAELMYSWTSRGPLYVLYANSLMLDYGGPSFAKRHAWMTGTYQAPRGQAPDRVANILYSTLTLSSYVTLGYEVGIRNQFNVLRMRGMTKEQSMELVLFTQLYAGMRGLGHTYHAVGDFLPAMGEPPIPLELPEGWEADPAAFRSGLDLTTHDVTKSDLENLTAWYEGTIGYVPDSIRVGLKIHPQFIKAARAKWEVAIRTLPKQFAPHLMIRQNIMSGSVEGLRESVLLGKAWGMTKPQIANGIANYCGFFAGIEGFYVAAKAIEDIWDAWE